MNKKAVIFGIKGTKLRIREKYLFNIKEYVDLDLLVNIEFCSEK